MCLITRAPASRPSSTSTGWTRTRRKWPALAKAYLRFAERTAPRWADEAITDSHAVPRSSSAATAAASAWCPTASRTRATTGTEHARAPGPRAAQVHPVRRAAGAREQPAPAGRGVRPHRRRARARDEARRRRRRALRRRVHPAGHALRRPARGLPRLRLRPRLLGAPAPRLPVLRADRGGRHAPGDPRGARRRQLRARQRPRAQRRDGRRRRPVLLRRERASTT